MMPPVREKLYEDTNIEVLCDYIINRTKVSLHLTFKKDAWTPNKFKRYKSILAEQILPFLRDKSYKEVYATPFENDVKAQKLITMFGFKEFARNGGFVLMKRGV